MSEISVVIGAQNALDTIEPCLRAVLSQTDLIDAEVIVADSSDDGTAEVVEKHFPQVRLIRSAPGGLVPHLWGIGMQQATAPLVAITTAHCIPSDTWLSDLLQCARENPDYAALGGAIDPPSGKRAKDWAVYFSRYTAYMPPTPLEPADEIPGDNAVYRKDALERCWTERSTGFWENLFHHNLRKSGLRLIMSPGIRVHLGPTENAGAYFWARYKHGKHYGSSRPETSGASRVMRILAAPALMPYLVLRMGVRIGTKRPDWLPLYLKSLPWLLYFMTGWSLGEISGYTQPGGYQRNATA